MATKKSQDTNKGESDQLKRAENEMACLLYQTLYQFNAKVSTAEFDAFDFFGAEVYKNYTISQIKDLPLTRHYQIDTEGILITTSYLYGVQTPYPACYILIREPETDELLKVTFWREEAVKLQNSNLKCYDLIRLHGIKLYPELELYKKNNWGTTKFLGHANPTIGKEVFEINKIQSAELSKLIKSAMKISDLFNLTESKNVIVKGKIVGCTDKEYLKEFSLRDQTNSIPLKYWKQENGYVMELPEVDTIVRYFGVFYDANNKCITAQKSSRLVRLTSKEE